MKSNGKSTTPIIAAQTKKNNGNKPAPPSQTKGNGAKRVSRVSSSAATKMKCHALERINDGVLALDTEMNHVYVNERAGEILGYEPQNLIGKNFQEIFPGLMGKPFLDACQRALETQTVVPFNGYFAPSDMWFEARAYPSQDGVSVLLRQSARSLEGTSAASYSFYDVSQFPEQNPNPVMRFTRSGELLYGNPASAPILNAWKGQTRHNLPIELQELLFVVSEIGSNKEIELENRGKTYSCLLVPVPESGYVNLYFSDITERRRAQESVNALIHQATTGITRVDTTGKFLFVNQAFCEMVGYSESELLDKKTWEINHPDDMLKNQRLFERLVVEGEPYQLEKRIVRRNGSIIWVTAGVSPLRDSSGQIYAAVTVVVDITRRKRAEESLLDSARRTLYLASLSDAIRPLSNPSQIQAEAVRILGSHVRASRVFYAKIKPDGTASVKDSYAAGLTKSTEAFNINEYVPGELLTKLRAGRAIIISDTDRTDRSSDPLNVRDGPVSIRTQVVIPLIREGELVAALFIQQSQQRDWKNEEISIMEETAERMQTAIERASVEQELRESEKRFRILSNTVPSMVWSAAPDGTIQDLNEYWHRYTGLTTEESISNWRSIIHPEDYERVSSVWNHSLTTGEDYALELRYRRSDGEYRWFQSRAIPARDDSGNIIAWYGASTDIHDRMENEAELQEVINHTPFMMTRCTRDLRYRFVSHAYAEMIHRTPEQVAGKPIIEIMGEKGFKTILPYVEQVLQGKRVEYETEVSFENVGTPALHVVYIPDYDAHGQVIGWFASVLDLTERKIIEDQLKQSNQRLNEILTSIQDDFYVLDRDWKFVYANSLFTSKVGKEPEDFIGKSIWEMFPKHVGTSFEENFRAVMEKRESRRFEIGGKYTNAWYQMAAFPSADGITVLGTDITERKRAEDQLRELSQRLTYHVDNSPLAVIEWGPDMRLSRWSGTAERIFGWKAEEVLGKRIEELPWVYKEDIQQVNDVSNDLQTGNDIHRFSANRNYRKDGSVAYCEWYNSSLMDESGNLRSILSLVLDVTERKRAEEEIHDLNAQLQLQLDETEALLDILPTGVWIGNEDCSVITGNTAAYEIMGLPSGINASMTSSEPQMPAGVRLFVNGEEVAPEAAPMQAVAYSGKPLYNIEHDILFENGIRKSVVANVVPLFDNKGSVRKVIGAYTDFTERKQTEQALARERILLERLFETMPVMVSMYDPATQSLRLNAEFERTTGWKAEEVSTASLLAALYPDPEYRMDILRRMAAAANSKEWVEVKVQTRDGRTLDSLWSNISIMKDEQLVTGVAIGIDITGRKRMEQDLEHERELLNRIIDSIPVMLTVYEPSTNLLRLNAQFEKLTGWNNEEAVGVSLMEACYPDPEYREMVRDFMASARENEWMDVQMRTRDGGVLETSWSNIRLSNNMQVGIGIDITERKHGERALVEYARQQSALYKLVDQLHRADTLEDVFDASLDAILSALQCNRASILLFDETKKMHFVAWRGLSEEYRKATDGHSPWKYGEEDPLPIWYNDTGTSDLSDALKAVVAKEGIGSLAFIPLVYQETLIGKFMVYFDTPHAFTESEANLSQTIARQLASGVDRKRAEERLRTSEDRLRLAVAAGKIGIWDMDIVRRDRSWSKEGKAIYGLSEDENLDLDRQLELTHPEDRDYVDQAVKAFRDEGTIKQLSLEHRIIHPDGSIHWVEVLGEAVYGEGPLPVRLIGTIVDITERKLIEQSLRQSEERFAQFMQYLPGLAWIKDVRGHYVFANADAERAFGVQRDDLYGKTDVEVFPPDVAAQFTKNDDLAVTEAKGIQVVEMLEQDGGVVHYSLVTKFPIPGADGKPALIGGTAFDITEQRQMEIALRESEERYRALVNQATAGIVRKDVNGGLLFVNDAFCEMLGYSASELKGKTMWQITHPEDVGENRRLYNRLMTEGVPFQLEKRLIRRDGSIIWATVSVSPVLDTRGKPESAVSVYADITERRQAEGRLALLAEVSDLVRRMENPVELMSSVANVVGRHFQVKRCLFNEIDIANDCEIVHRDYHDGVESVAGTHKLTDYSSITTQEMIAGKTIVNVDSKTDPRTAPDYERSYVPNGERAYVAVPLMRENTWVASLWTSDDKPRQWSEDEVALLQTIAERTWTATEKLRINAALRDSEERLRKLNTELEQRVQRRTAELQAANEFLRESEATSRLILESMPDAIIIADKQGRIVYGNTQVETLFGYSAQEVIGRPVEILVPPRFHGNAVDYRIDYDQNPQRRHMGLGRDLFGQRKDQSEFPVDVMLSPISNNTNWDVMVTIRDNTEQKQAQQALRANEEKLRKLFQVLPVGISFLDSEGQITEMNSALTEVLELSRSELLEGRFKHRRYIRADGTAMPSSEFASIRATKERKPVYNVETGIVKEDGQTIWTSVNAAPVDIAEVDVVVATIDITERKKAEEALHKHRERLRILSRRLVEVQEEERRAIARELHDRVGQNLAALNLNLNILRSQLTSTALLEVGQRLNDSVNLVNQILTITRNVMGDLRSDVLDDYGLEAALREYAEQFSARTGVQVLFDKSAKPIPRTDPSIEMTLLRIAQEALTNVARHAQAKQASVSVSADTEAVYMSIQDDGIGILSWQRANQPGSHGLRIIRERAEAFGGSLQVQSTYKKGTRIDVKIPLGNLSQSSRVPREKRS